MTTSNPRRVPAFLASDVLGNTAAVVLSTYATEGGVPVMDAERDALEILSRVMRATRFTEMKSYSVQKPSVEFMPARVKFLLDKAFEDENTVILARCDSPETRDAFYKTIKQTYQVVAIPMPSQAAA